MSKGNDTQTNAERHQDVGERLVEFAVRTLETLEEHAEWNPDTLQDIADAAYVLLLADGGEPDEGGRFRAVKWCSDCGGPASTAGYCEECGK